MRFRFACKEFDPERKIPDEDFQCILEAARLAPSSFGFEPWKLLVVQNPDLREAIRAICWGTQTQLPGASHFVVIQTRKPTAMYPQSDYIQKTIMLETQHWPVEMRMIRTQKYDTFLKSDFEIIGNERACFEWAARQCYLALGSMLNAAALLGIDSCPCEGFPKAMLETLLIEQGVLDGEEYGVGCMVSFGYRKEPPKREKTRRSMQEVVQWVK